LRSGFKMAMCMAYSQNNFSQNSGDSKERRKTAASQNSGGYKQGGSKQRWL
jgi:hypothetical protein